ncbi:hypothetical protein [Pseudomonas antarctica]|uniref:hypothetical protein n=1 Tax=Pseudomonas antarctica TaxID=219572 RepID=UPI000AAB8827|nr:hypothetical protein [Pseudomonas antarctica]
MAQSPSSSVDAAIRSLIRYIPGHEFLVRNLPDDPVLLKQMLGQMLGQMLDERQLDKGKLFG